MFVLQLDPNFLFHRFRFLLTLSTHFFQLAVILMLLSGKYQGKSKEAFQPNLQLISKDKSSWIPVETCQTLVSSFKKVSFDVRYSKVYPISCYDSCKLFYITKKQRIFLINVILRQLCCSLKISVYFTSRNKLPG